jgi:hypothetical protein
MQCPGPGIMIKVQSASESLVPAWAAKARPQAPTRARDCRRQPHDTGPRLDAKDSMTAISAAAAARETPATKRRSPTWAAADGFETNATS